MAHIQVYKNFYSKARFLRSEFDSYFEDPKNTHAKRFVWDKWYVRDQYHLVRTPAYHYFSKKCFDDFQSHLIQWGRENLGCHSISPPWLSYYTEGCFQNFHSDVPHGPWAYVYSLTPLKKMFSGGETIILKPQTLDYWNTFSDEEDREYSSFVDRVPSLFNQLVVFDPRYPHGVTEVKGTHDPQQARLVVHGWFVEPRPYVVGGLSTAQVQKSLDPCFAKLNEELSTWPQLHGTVSLRLRVNKLGDITRAQLVSSTLQILNVDIRSAANQNKLMVKELLRVFKCAQFPRSKSDSLITLPLLFK